MATTKQQREEYKRNKASKMGVEGKLEFLIYFLDKMCIPYTINRNPSPEEIERIRGEIKRSEQIVNQIQKHYIK